MSAHGKTRLGVNVDHVATVRQARRACTPDPVQAALDAVRGGARGITAHLREDRRHIQVHDIERLKKKLSVPLNLEMAAVPSIINIAKRIRPHWVCLVPERRAELTTEGGLNILWQANHLKSSIATLHRKGIKVSVFVAPTLETVRQAVDLKADAIEIHTGHYATLFDKNYSKAKTELNKIHQAALLARRLGLIVNAGHGLDYENVGPLAKIFAFHEFNIGFSIIGRALAVGMTNAVSEMKEIIEKTCAES